MTIIYLINHSTSKLFNEGCIYVHISLFEIIFSPPQFQLLTGVRPVVCLHQTVDAHMGVFLSGG